MAYPQPCHHQPISMEGHPTKIGRGHMDRKSVGKGKGDLGGLRTNDMSKLMPLANHQGQLQ